MNSRFIAPGESRWTEVLGTVPHDAYHLPGYVALAGRQEGAVPVAFLAEEDGRVLLVPILLRPIATGDEGRPLLDATSPYGYPGPILSAPAAQDPGFIDRALGALVDQLRRRDVVAAFFRLDPLRPVPVTSLMKFGWVIAHGDTVAIDLTLSRAEQWHQLRASHRRAPHRLERRGFHARIDDRWERFHDFVEVYRETMTRRDAAPYYRFSDDYFTGLRAAVGKHLHLAVVEHDETVAAAGLFFEVDGVVQYHLGGSRAIYAGESPLKGLLDAVRWWAKDRGDRVFHLGGGLGGRNDSLFAFKAGFSPIHHPFHTWRIIADPPAYDRLVAAWEARHRHQADGADGYFPAYRKVPHEQPQ